MNGNLEKDKIINQTIESLSIDVPVNELVNHRIVSIVWKANARGKFDFVEARSLYLGDVKVGVKEDAVTDLQIKAYFDNRHVVLESNKGFLDVKKIHVVNSLGQILSSSYQYASLEKIELDLNDYTGGVYFVRVLTGNSQITIPIFLSRN